MEDKRKSNQVMAVVPTLGKEVMQIICAYRRQSERRREENWWSSVMKKSRAWQTRGPKRIKRKTTYTAGGYETENDLVLVGKKCRKYIRDLKVIKW